MATRAGRRAASLLQQLRRPMSSAAAPAASEPKVLFAEAGGLRVATLNRPKVLNSLDLDMVRLLTPMVRSWDSDGDAAVILLKGAGEKAFCAGGDVVSVAKSGKGGADGGAFARDFFREEYILDHLLARVSKPYVVFMDGITMGGGVGLSFPAPFRVVTERTLFAMPETGIGLFPDVGGSYYLPLLHGELGMWLALTGARLRGEDVVKAGVATHFVPSERLGELEAELAGVRSPDGDAVGAVLDAFDGTTSTEASFAPHLDDITRCFSAGSVEEVLERLAESGTEWADKQRATVLRMSPTSVKLSFAQLRRGQGMSLEDCFKMEYRLTQGCMRGVDFYEGIRALLIDKDNKPSWSPASLEEVTDELVESHFAPVDNDLEL